MKNFEKKVMGAIDASADTATGAVERAGKLVRFRSVPVVIILALAAIHLAGCTSDSQPPASSCGMDRS